MSERERSRGYKSTGLPVLALAAGLLSMAVSGIPGGTQGSQVAAPGRREIRTRVRQIIRKTLAQGRSRTASGIETWTRVPPSGRDVEEIVGYGEKAVSVLAEFLRSGEGPERLLAVQLLGRVGGRGIVEPLQQVVLSDPAPTMRWAALLSLTGGGPYGAVAAIVRIVAEKETDPSVRNYARGLIEANCPERR